MRSLRNSKFSAIINRNFFGYSDRLGFNRNFGQARIKSLLPSLPEEPKKLRLSIHDRLAFFQLAVLVPGPLKIKLRVFASFYWNLWDAVAIVWFTIGVILRFNPSTLNASRIVYTLNIVFFYIRILGILSVNKALGAYSKIIGKLVSVWV